MKELTRIKLINWHYFENVTIEIKGSALITGDNGVGKSTILDAIQYVLVADLRKVKFNISAFEETKRDLAGYIRCKIGSDTEGGLRSLRSGDITSYVVLEFYDDVKRRYFLLGVAVDSYSDGRTWDSKFFKVEDCRLEDSLFLAGRRPRNIRELKAALREYKSRFYATVEEYQNDLLVKLGNLRSDRFFHLLVKAISFKPITDIRQFVYSYVLEEKHVNIEVMKENLQRYREYSDLAARTREKLEFLAGIIDKYNEIVKEQEKVLLQEYLIRRGARDHASTLLLANLEELEKNEQELQKTGGKLETARENEDRSKKEYESYRDTLAANSAFQLVERLKGEIDNLTRGRPFTPTTGLSWTTISRLPTQTARHPPFPRSAGRSPAARPRHPITSPSWPHSSNSTAPRSNRDSIRLMMFDEAFNRMDSDRVENSLRFINELDMQAIIAAPTDKCEYIAPHVPTTLLVLREGHYSWIEDYKQLKLAEERTPDKDASETVA